MKKIILFILLLSICRCFVGLAKNNPSTDNKITMIEHTNYLGWPNCIKLSNGNIELIITTDVGPRIIRFGFVHEQNMFYVSSAEKGKTGGNEWRLYGGHRFWLAPEMKSRSYSPDNNRVKYSWNGKTIKLTQNIEPETNIVKEIEITMSSDKNEVEVLHRIINQGDSNIELAPWAISACAPGGTAIVPQEPYIDPADYLLPIRPIVLWAYTKMNDPRFKWGEKYIQAKQDPKFVSETKFGVLNKQEWAAFYLNKCLFVKTFKYNHDAIYPDYGCNNEIYINGDFLEVESLGPIVKIAPQQAIDHVECWKLVNLETTLGEDEKSIEKIMQYIF